MNRCSPSLSSRRCYGIRRSSSVSATHFGLTAQPFQGIRPRLCVAGQGSLAFHISWRSTPEREPDGHEVTNGSQFTTDNQLSLFSDTELADNLGEESLHDPNGAAHTPWIPDTGAFETPSAQDGREPGARESASDGDLRSAGVNGQPAVRADSGPDNGLPQGVRNRDE